MSKSGVGKVTVHLPMELMMRSKGKFSWYI